MNTKGLKPRSRTLKGDTLKALERAAMRMVDRNGWLVTREDCQTYEKRRDEFEDAISDRRAALVATKAK